MIRRFLSDWGPLLFFSGLLIIIGFLMPAMLGYLGCLFVGIVIGYLVSQDEIQSRVERGIDRLYFCWYDWCYNRKRSSNG